MHNRGLNVTSFLMIACLMATVTLFIVICADESANNSELDVVIIAGQSNAEYTPERCDVDFFNTTYTEKPISNLYYFGTDSYPQTYWDYEKNGNIFKGSKIMKMWTGDAWRIGGYEPYLGNEISKRNGNDVLILNIGVGGKRIDELTPGSTFGNYGFDLIDTAVHMISPSYKKVNMLFWVWIQGEADYNTPTTPYIADFRLLQSAFDGYGFQDCLIVHTRNMWGGNANIAQETIAEDDPNVTIVARCTETFSLDHGGCLLNEPGAYGIHYSCKGRITIAESLIKELDHSDLEMIHKTI